MEQMHGKNSDMYFCYVFLLMGNNFRLVSSCFKYNFYVLKVGHGFICIKVRIISINIIVNVKIFLKVIIIATVI